MRVNQLLYWLSLLGVKGIGPRKAWKIHSKVSTFEEALTMTNQDWSACGLSTSQSEELHAALVLKRHYKNAERIMMGYQFVLIDDPEYPGLLRHITTPPPILFYKGQFRELTKSVAVVGTRKCTTYGKNVAFAIARLLAYGEYGVVSGLAQGIDQAAHEGALEAGGVTFAVLGSGIDYIYPRQNQLLADRILANGGAVVSEFLPWTGPERHRFPMRNRIISGLSQAVVIVEAGVRSGALITADFALEQNREVYAVPGSIFSSASAGTNALIACGAIPLIHPAAMMTEFVTPEKNMERIAHEWEAKESDTKEEVVLARHIVHELQAAPMRIEELINSLRKSGFSMKLIQTSIAQMEVSNAIQRTDDGQYVLVGNSHE
ncbi:DNA-processing protein DprA [Sulfoacidibacillus thermotolerans]|uniref:DNA protecting protein DprA n=1 Tax=Sulfoacidibacillus thermotolerans TaxID=1765684 RepID=A0A2U3DA66_SULT2|nr:DNA-processing protein DprA [Sulfoacidibacillus thermotolerans]PWI58178.1 DNA protecting protein DprA [Sulfoacidibacillus thermotolerans]